MIIISQRKKIYLPIIVSIIILSYSCQRIQYQNNNDNFKNEIFIPDSSVKKLAEKFDAKYYALFLESLGMIKNKNFNELSYYFNNTVGEDSLNDKIFISIHDYKSNIKLIYRSSNIFYKSELDNYDHEITFPIDWSSNPLNDNTWELWYESLNWLDNYLQSNNKDSLLVGFKIIEDWILSHTDYPVKNQKFDFGDHAPAVRLKILYSAFRAYQAANYTDPFFKNLLLTSILNHISFISSLEKYSSWHNHGIIFDHSLISVLSDFNEFIYKEDILNLAYTRVFEQLRYCYTSEGIHKEHSPCYHYYMTKWMQDVIEKALSDKIEIPENIYAIYKLATDYNKYLQINGNSLRIGDCNGRPIGSFINSSSTNNQLEHVKIFPLTGWAFFNSKPPSTIRTVIQADFFSYGHYQEDETSFVIYDSIFELIIDPGIHSYNKTPLDIYMRKSRAHNVLIIDDEDFERNFKNTGLSGITKCAINENPDLDWKAIVEMTHPHYNRLGVNVYRQFGQINDSSFIVKDMAISSEKHNYSQLFHFAPEANIQEIKGGFLITWPYHNYKIWLFSVHDSYEIIIGDKSPYQGWYFPKLNDAVPAPVLYLNKAADTCIFMTSLVISSNVKLPDTSYLSMEADIMFKEFEMTPRKALVQQPYPKRWGPRRNQ